ncbi:hypothetical protein KUV73_21100 [Mameliella alba]|nr:hypothetical protein [Mameliella alba]MBY6171655.1 hypothetical protein [Mameliella alba]MBY6176880.1 hypothetical protein [Mameliella alba]
MKRFAMALCAALSLSVPPALAADFRVVGMTNDAFDIQGADPDIACTHRLTGQFAPGDGDRMAGILRNSIEDWRKQNKWGKSVICLDSPGGSIAEALKLGAALREMAVGTKLEAGARCESACALLFMAGSFYAHESGYYKWRVMHPTAKLGFHAPSLQVGRGQYDGATVTRAYALAMETLARTIEDLMQNRGFEDGEHLKPSLIATMLRTPPDSMFYIDTVDQAGRWGIQIGPLRDSGRIMTEMDFRRTCANQKAWEADETATEDPYWDQYFVNWVSDEWSDKVEIITNDMTGESCAFFLPKGAAQRKSVPLNQVQSGFVPLVQVLDPSTRLAQLPY